MARDAQADDTRRSRWRASALGIVSIVAATGALACAIAFVVISARDSEAAAPDTLGRPILDIAHADGLQANLAARVGLDRRLGPVMAQAAAANMCLVFAQPGGSVVADHNSAATFVPASTMKIATASAALGVLGPETRFGTEVLRGPDGTIYLRGGGDPTLSSPEWAAARPDRLSTSIVPLAEVLKSSGADVSSGIVADASWLGGSKYVDGWEQRLIRQQAAPPVSALTVDRSFPELAPEAPANADDDPALGAAATLARLAGAPGAPVRAGTVPADAVLLGAVESPTVIEIVTDMGKWSDNLAAEVLVRQIGRAARADASTAAGTAAVKEYLGSIGVDVSELTVADGSGLHYANQLSCSVFADLFEESTEETWGDALTESLAIGDVDGTLRDRRQPESVRAKTGTLRDVATLAGVIAAAEGDMAFAIMMNNMPDDYDARGLQDRLVTELAAWPAP